VKEDGPLRVASPEVGPTGSEKGGMTCGPESGKEKKRKRIKFKYEIDTLNLLKLDLIQSVPSQTQKILNKIWLENI
jgi:hypothetical protein